MHMKILAIAVLCLAGGAAFGWWLKGDGIKAPVSSEQEVRKSLEAVQDRGKDASISALRARIAELERQLKAMPKDSVATARADKVESQGDRFFGNMRDRMEQLKQNDPKRFAQITNRVATFVRHQAERLRNKMEYLSTIDTSHMSSGAKKTHDALQELLARRDELMERAQQPDLTDEQRRQLMGEMFGMHGELQRLSADERVNLLDEMSKSLGFEGDDAKEISATIQNIIEATDEGFRFPHGGRRHHGEPPPPRP